MSDPIDDLLAAQAAGPKTSGMSADPLDALLSAQASGATAPKSAGVADDMSTFDRLRAATGMGMAKVGRAVGQLARNGLEAIAPPQKTLSDLVTGAPGKSFADTLGLPTQTDIDEANRLDASLAGTTAGKIGNFVGQAAMAAPAMLIPGANTYLGATAIGAGVGGLTTEGGLADRAQGAAFGALGGAGGKALGDALGAGVRFIADRRAAAQAANAGRDTAAIAAKNAGFVIPPADINPTMLNEALNGLSGKTKTAQQASAANQSTVNGLAKSAIGAPANDPLSIGALNTIRNQAGQAYDAVGSTGLIRPTQAYSDALDAITAPYVKAAQGFPNAKPSPIIADIESLKSPEFDAASAVAKIKTLRADADAAFGSGNKDLGQALKGGANALEDAIDTHLTSIGAPADLLGNFRDARQLIAKTYTVQKALNDATGDVSAQVLGKQLQKGKPLTGDLLTIAQANSAFPKALQSLKEAPKALSPLDYMGGIVAATATGHPALGVGIAARPAIRAGILSDPYQRLMTTPSYQPGMVGGLLENTLSSDALRNLAPAEMGLLSTRLSQ